MRILMLSDVYLPRVNGVSTSIETFRRELLGMGHDVVLVAPDYGGIEDDERVERVAGRRVPRDTEDRMMSWTRLRRRLSVLGRGGWNVVHTHTPFVAHYAGARFAARHGLPLVTSYHTWFEHVVEHYAPTTLAEATRALTRWFSRRQCLMADAVIVPSSAMAEQLCAYGVPACLQYVLPTGLTAVDFEPGDGAAFRAMHGLAPDRPMALFVGRVAHEKNITFLIDALREVRDTIPNALLVVVGGGPALASVLERAARIGASDGVRCIGYLPRGPALAGAYAAADLFVFASRTETQGLVLLEAMAQGTPVLALAERGTCGVLDGCTGAQIASGKVDDFARKWITLLRDEKRRAELSAGARATARAWRNQPMSNKLVELYASLVHRHRCTTTARGVDDGLPGGKTGSRTLG